VYKRQALGSEAGNVITGGYKNTIIGAASDPGAADAINQTAIGYGVTAVDTDNTVTIGNADVNAIFAASDMGASIYCKAVNFSTTQPAADGTVTVESEELDHYEEGYITETITCEGSGGYNLNGSLNTLAYTKIGRVVHIQGSIQVDSENSPSGILQIDLPFTSASLTENSDILFVPGFQLRNHGDAGLENCVLEILASASKAAFHNFTDAGTKEGISESRVDTAFEMYFSFSYIAA
jgi:hypothetical protein